jgi:short-subunit dehydrogenase
MACRNPKKGEEAARELKCQVSGKCELDIIALDLSSLASIRECASQLIQNKQSIHVLINNAGM